MIVQRHSTNVDMKPRLTVPASRTSYGFTGWGPRLGY
jgi:hypothetical protein